MFLHPPQWWRGGGRVQVQREDANTSCLRLSHHQWIVNIAVCCFGFYSASAWTMICVSRRVWSNDHLEQMVSQIYFQVALYSSSESSEYPLCVLCNEIIIKNPSALICLQVALLDRPRRLDGLILQQVRMQHMRLPTRQSTPNLIISLSLLSRLCGQMPGQGESGPYSIPKVSPHVSARMGRSCRINTRCHALKAISILKCGFGSLNQ